MMTLTLLSCPACRAAMKVPAGLTDGQRVRCPKCSIVFPAGGAAAPSGPGTVGPAPTPAAQDTTADRRDAPDDRTHDEAADDYATREPDGPSGPDPRPPDAPGRLGPYRLLKVLGKGGMGLVYEAEDPRLKRHVALKVMLPQFAANDTARRRFLREAQAQAALEHDHVVAIFQADEDHGVPYIAMPLLKGQTLADCLQREGRLEPAEVLRIGRETAEGLAAAHERGLIHRDIKPGNLWLEGKRRRVKVLDYGLARAAQAIDDAHLTGSGVAVGTPAFMSPEQAEGRPLDARSDLFSLGSVLYVLTTGTLPFQGPSTMAVLTALATHAPAPPRTLNPALPAGLDALIVRLLAKAPADRPASAAEVADALAALEKAALAQASTEAIAAPAVAPPVATPVQAPARRRPRRALLVAGGLLLLVGGGLLVAQAVVRIVNKDGTETRIDVPKDAAVIVEKDGKKIAEVRPAPKPPPAVVPVAEEIDFAAERRAAEKLLTLKKGNIGVNLDGPDGKFVAQIRGPDSKLPDGPFCITYAMLQNCDLSDEDLAYLADCSRLGHLDLNGNTKLTDQGIRSLRNVRQLRVLDLSFCFEIGDQAMDFVGANRHLETLKLLATKVTDAGVEALKNCPRLRVFYLPNAATDRSLTLVSEQCRELRFVDLNYSFKATLKPLAKLPRLRKVGCNGEHLTPDGVAALASVPYLEALVVAPPSPAGLVERLKPLAGRLRAVEFASCYDWDTGIPADAWEPLFGFAGLEELFIGGVKHAVDGNLLRKAAAMRDLRKLRIEPAPAKQGYTAADVATFRKKRPDVALRIRVGDKIEEYPGLERWPEGPDGGLAAWDLPKDAPPPAVAPFGAAEAKKHQEAWAAFLTQPVEVEGKVGMKFRLIPPGEFDTTFPFRNLESEGGPAARVRITQPFYLGTTEVTVGQYRKFVQATGYKTEAERGLALPSEGGAETWLKPNGYEPKDEYPVALLSLADCQAFCDWLSSQGEEIYRLPTEAEWELAARAGGLGPWVYGQTADELSARAWLHCGSPHAVGSKKANPFGLFDMIGNVWEQCIGCGRAAAARMIDPVAGGRALRGAGYIEGAPRGVPEWHQDYSSVVWRHVGFRVLRQTTREPLPVPKFGDPVLVKPGGPLSPQAAVSRPAPIKDVRRWSVELAGHLSNLGNYNAIAWSPRGDLVATAADDFRVALWDRDGNLKRVLLGHTGRPTCLSFSPDGKRLACGDHKCGEPGASAVRIWDVETGAFVHTIPTESLVWGVCFGPSSRELLVHSRLLRRINLDTGAQITSPETLSTGHFFQPPSAWSSDGKRILANRDGKAVILNAQTLKVEHQLTSPDEPGNGGSVGFPYESADGKWLAAMGSDKKVRVWDARTRQHARTISLSVQQPIQCAWHPKAPRLAVSGDGPTGWEVFDVTDGRSLARGISPDAYNLALLAWSPDGAEIVTPWQGRLLFCDSATGKRLRQAPDRGYAQAWPITLSPDGTQLVSGGVWSAETGKLLRRLAPPVGAYTDAAWSPRGDVVAFAFGPHGKPRMIWLYDPTTGKRTAELQTEGGTASYVSWSPDGKRLAAWGDNLLWVIDVANRKVERQWAIPATTRRLAWSPDGKRIATAACRQGLQLWDAASGKLVTEYKQFPVPNDWALDITAMAWAPDGRDLWVSGFGNHVFRVDTVTGRVRPPEAFSSFTAITALSLARDGDSLLVCEGYHNNFELRDRDGNHRLFGQHPGSYLNDPSWHPDARRFVGLDQRGIRGFDTRRERRLGTLYPNVGDNRWLVIGPDGHWRGSDGIEQHIVYVALLEDGSQRTYTPAEFAKQFGWRNDPQKARLMQLDP